MPVRSPLGEYLRARRERLRPQDVGLPTVAGRRVAGLRREELAVLAGVSVDYYVRLEQGRVARPSEQVVDALARALRLDDAQRAHLHALAVPVRARSGRQRDQRVRPGLQRLLDALIAVPAFVVGRRADLVGWNALGAALHGDLDALPSAERNMARLLFLDQATRDLYPDWEEVARDTVGLLRRDAGRHPDDPALAELVGELSVKDADFRAWWAAHHVYEKSAGTKRFAHPVVGELTLAYETLSIAGEPDQILVVYTAEPASPSADALALLGAWAASHPQEPSSPLSG